LHSRRAPPARSVVVCACLPDPSRPSHLIVCVFIPNRPRAKPAGGGYVDVAQNDRRPCGALALHGLQRRVYTSDRDHVWACFLQRVRSLFSLPCSTCFCF
jgi:hypothetical protein